MLTLPTNETFILTDDGRAFYTDDAIADALTSRGYRGVKSIIAYRTGLDVSPLSRTTDQGY